MTVNWQEPPSKQSGRAISPERQALLAELRANPGRWALVAEAVSPANGTDWKKRYGVETRTVNRSGQPGLADLYARWPES